MVNDGDCIAIFHSVHRVMKAEKILKEQQFKFLLIPVPRQLSADCGLAIRFSLELRDEVERALTEACLSVVETWLMQSGKFQFLS